MAFEHVYQREWLLSGFDAAARLMRKAHDYEVLAASHSEREALLGGGEWAE